MSDVHLAILDGRPAAAEVKRIAIALVDDAVEQLRDAAAAPSETAVHEARKRFKELRALLRLVESAAGRHRTKEARLRARDAGRSLSAARDADVLGETFEKLHERFGDSFDRSRDFARRLTEDARGGKLDTDTASRLISAVRNSIALWSFDVADKDIQQGLRRGLRRARRAMRTAVEVRSDAGFHEWRKRAKDSWYHARMTEEIVPSMRDREPQLRRLARILGDHHDLVIVREIAGRHAGEANGPDAVNVLSLALQRMRELEDEAEAIGPEALARKL